MPAIRVVARFRPINKKEIKEQNEKIASGEWQADMKINVCEILKDEKFKEGTPSKGNCIKVDLDDGNPPRPFTIDSVWPSDTQQKDFFVDLGVPMVHKAVAGINSTSFCYGQTGAGKSFSMFGKEPMHITAVEEPFLLGVLPRASALIFAEMGKRKEEGIISDYKITLECYEIYLDTIFDLLPKKGPPRKIPLVKKEVQHVFIVNLSLYEVEDDQDLLIKVATGYGNRHTAPTAMNPASSRGHCIFRLGVKQIDPEGTCVKAAMSFVDLAGSEKMAKTGITHPDRIQEARMINGSLTALGKVIRDLVKRKKSVPFRDNCLPHCLKESLIGNCVTTLVTALSPHYYNRMETANTLRFGMQARCLVNKVKANKQLSPAQMKKLIQNLKDKVTIYEKALKAAGIDPKSLDPNAAKDDEKEEKKEEKKGGGGGGDLPEGAVAMSSEDVERLKQLEEDVGRLNGEVGDLTEKYEKANEDAKKAQNASSDLEQQIAQLVAEKRKDLFGDDGQLLKITYLKQRNAGGSERSDKADGLDEKAVGDIKKVVESSKGDKMNIAGLLEWERVLIKKGMDSAKGDTKKVFQIAAHNARKIEQAVNALLQDIRDGAQNIEVINSLKVKVNDLENKVVDCRQEIKDKSRSIQLYKGAALRLDSAQTEIMQWRNIARGGGGAEAIDLLKKLEDDEKGVGNMLNLAGQLGGKQMGIQAGVNAAQAMSAAFGGGGGHGPGGVGQNIDFVDEWAEEKAQVGFDPDLGRKLVFNMSLEEVVKLAKEVSTAKIGKQTSMNRKSVIAAVPDMGHTHMNQMFGDLNVRGDGIIKTSQIQGFVDAVGQRVAIEKATDAGAAGGLGIDKQMPDLVKQSMLIHEDDMIDREAIGKTMAHCPDITAETIDKLYAIANPKGEEKIPGYLWKQVVHNLSKATGGDGLPVNIPLDKIDKEDMSSAFHLSVDLKKIFKEHGKDGKLSIGGAKTVIAALRECKKYQIRDEDNAMAYLTGFSEDQIMGFVEHIHPTMWEILSNFNHYERLFVVFEGLDNGGGLISPEGFKKGMKKIGVDADDALLDTTFEKIDTDKNGTIDYTEFAAFIESHDLPTEMLPLRRELQTCVSIPMVEQEDYRDITIEELENDAYQWNAGRVGAWLESIGAKAYVKTFKENDVNGTMLLKDLESADLKDELGVKGVWVKKILAAREDLRETSVRYQDDKAILEAAEVERLMETAQKKRQERAALGQTDDDDTDAAAIMGGIAFETLGNDVQFQLDIPQFKQQLKNFGVRLSENQMEVVFHKMDTDHGGTLDYKEFMKFLQLRDAFGIVDPGQGAGPPVRKEMVAKATMVIGACFKQGKKRRDVVQFLEKKGVSKKEINIAFANYVSNPDNVPQLDMKKSEKVEFDDFKLLKLMRRVGVETKGHDKFNDVNFYRNLNAPATVSSIEVWFDDGTNTCTGFHTSYKDRKGAECSGVNHYFVHEDMNPEKFTLKLDDDEHLVGCEIWTHGTDETQVSGVTFTTNKRLQQEYGTCDGPSDGCLIAPEGSQLIAWYGSVANGFVESLGAYVVRTEPGRIDTKTGKILSAAQCAAMDK